MTDAPAAADPALVAAAEAALAASAERTVLVEHGGARYVAKRLAHRPRRRSQALLLRWLVERVTGERLPMRTLRLSEAAASVDYEAQRLAALERAGVAVPRVAHRGADYLLLAHCGTTLATRLETWTLAEAEAELPRLAGELGAFHRAGHWHGAAQVKNLTRRDGSSTTWRIDFEEDFGDLVPLPAAQALDLVLFLNSLSLAGPLEVDAATARLLPALIAAYFAANPDAQVRAVLQRALPWVVALGRVASPFRRLRWSGRRRKGAARVALLAEALSAHFATG